MKRCPHCSQAIQDDTQICPHCKFDFATAGMPPPQAAVPLSTYGQAPLAGDAYASGHPSSPPQNSGKATGSLIAGIAAFVVAPFLGALVAIVLGHMGLSEIRKSAGRLKGDGMAIAGLVLGYLQFAGIPVILIVAAIAIPNLLRARMAANEASAVGSLRTLTTAEIRYAEACPKIGYAHAMVEMGPGGSACREGSNAIDGVLAGGVKNGYRFTPHIPSFTGNAPESGFGWNADPLSTGSTGTRHFFVDQTGVIRFNASEQANETSPPLS
jgi:type IV pilus assembly protein PilA